MKLDFDDILITPEILTSIESRKKVNPYNINGCLPLFTAPMDTVVNSKIIRTFTENSINVVLPRTEKYKKYLFAFNSYGFDELDMIIPSLSNHNHDNLKILIDVANGHQNRVIQYAREIKRINSTIVIMAGNIANPNTYKIYCESGVIDYARIGIGNGNGCLTTQQTGIGYPLASLIIECNEIKKKYENSVKIIADGGMKKYSDIIKALALGADYVMIGNIFNKALESASQSYFWKFKLNNKWEKKIYNLGLPIHKEFRGMSTKKSQKILGNTHLKTSEGVIRKQYVEYTLSQWVNNFSDYLKSSMSYTDSKTLKDFIGNVKYEIISQNSFNRFNK